MDLLEFDHTLRTQGLEAALRALFIILQNLMTTVEELHKLQVSVAAPEKPAAAPLIGEGNT